MRVCVTGICCILALAGCRDNAPLETIPAGYPASYGERIRAADGEGRLDIWSAVDKQKVAPLVAEFERHYPHIAVRYLEMPASSLNERFRMEAKPGRQTVDLLWSSAMDLQIKIVNDGLARKYASPEIGHLPRWANWKNQAWGTSAEPIVFLYNRRLVPESEMPQRHDTLLRYLERRPVALDRRFGTYDIQTSAVGYLYFSQDAQAQPDIWRLVRAMAGNGAHFYSNAEQMAHDLADRKLAIAYNIVGSYALKEMERNRDLGMVIPQDYTLLMSRIALIPGAARHPHAAGLFLDFLLSPDGQRLLAKQDIPPVRDDIPGPDRLAAPGVPLRAIRVGPALLVTQDRLTRLFFSHRWSDAIRDGHIAGGLVTGRRQEAVSKKP